MHGLQDILDSIEPVGREIEPEIRSRLDELTKPRGSLGMLEDIVLQYCLIRKTTKPKLNTKAIYTFAANHGVAVEGVSAYPQEVTAQMVRNMMSGGAAINVLAAKAEADCVVVDMGVMEPRAAHPNLVSTPLRPQTHNMVEAPAMTIEEALHAINVGRRLACDAVTAGVDLIGTGDIGIANTTSAAALCAALLPCQPENVVGFGTGISAAQREHKINIVARALSINHQRLTCPLETLAALGGFEIAGICGLVLGSAAKRIPVVIDGCVSTAAALVALRLCPRVRDYLFMSHVSAENGHSRVLAEMGLEPILDLRLRLGEGTGAALAIPIIEASVCVYNEMATFDEASVSGRRR